jgi:hypothetical protein
MNSTSNRFLQIAVLLAAYLFLQAGVGAQPGIETKSDRPSHGPRPAPHSPANPQDQPMGGDTFYFGGGTPYNFVEAVRGHFGVQWGISTIPDEMRNARVPALRLKTEVVRDVEKLVRLYNSIGEQNPEMGQWVLEGAPERPDVLLLVPGRKPGTQPERDPAKARAVVLRGIPLQQWNRVEKDIQRGHEELLKMPGKTELLGRSHFRLHTDSEILMAYGSEPFLQMVESIVTAHSENTAPAGSITRAFRISRISEDGWEKLAKDLAQAKEFASRAEPLRQSPMGFDIHPDTKFLMAFGPEAFLQMVEEIVAATLRAEIPPGR